MTRRLKRLALLFAATGLLGAISGVPGARAEPQLFATPTCSLKVYDPYVSAGYVYGKVSATCSAPSMWLYVNVSLRSPTGAQVEQTKRCDYASSCTHTVRMPYTSGVWQTFGVGENQPGWYVEAASNRVQL